MAAFPRLRAEAVDMHKTYFDMVQHPVTARGAAENYYLGASDDVISRFQSVNGLKPGEQLYPGRILLVPSLDGGSEAGLSALYRVSTQTDYHVRNGVGSSPSQFNDDFHLANFVASSPDEMKIGAKVLKGATLYLKEHIGGVEQDLKDLAGAYKKAQRAGHRLGSSEAKAIRTPFEASLKSRLVGLSKNAVLKHAHKPSMKDALGISHRSLDKAFRATGNPADVKPISDALTRTAVLSKHLKTAGTVAKTLSVGADTIAVIDEFRTKGAQADSFHFMSRKAGALAGGTAAGAAGATWGAGAAGFALVAFGVGTGGLGIVAIGIGAAAGGLLAGALGSYAGEKAVDTSIIVLNKTIEAAVDWYVEPNQ